MVITGIILIALGVFTGNIITPILGVVCIIISATKENH